MARVKTFVRADDQHGTAQPSEVECSWKMFDYAGTRLVQLDTFGSAHRKNPGKQSQTLQLDRDAARSLVAILNRAFPPAS